MYHYMCIKSVSGSMLQEYSQLHKLDVVASILVVAQSKFVENMSFPTTYHLQCSTFSIAGYVYSIAGNFFVSYIWPKSPQNKYSYVLLNFICQSYQTTPMQLTYGLQHVQHDDPSPCRFMSPFSFCFD